MTWLNNETSTLAGSESAVGGAQGATIASAATITVTDFVHTVTGAAAISTINGGIANGLYCLIPDVGATWTLATGGNINRAVTPTVGTPIFLLLDGTTWRIADGGGLAGLALLRSGGTQTITAPLNVGSQPIYSGAVQVVPGSLVAPRLTEDKIAIGTLALSSQAAPTDLGSVGIGYHAFRDLVTGDDGVAIGSYAAERMTNQYQTVAVGSQALRYATASPIGANTVVGAQAARGLNAATPVTGNRNAIVGYAAGVNLSSGSENAVLGGSDTFAMATTCSGNVAVGPRSMAEATGGATDDVGIGNEALHSGVAGNQIVDGAFAAVGLPNWTVGGVAPPALGSGWAAGAGCIAKNAAGTGVLTPCMAVTSVPYIDYGVGTVLTIRFTIQNLTAGEVAVEFGGAALAGSPFNANGVYEIVGHIATAFDATLATTLKFTPTDAARFELTNVQVYGITNSDTAQNVAIGNGALYMAGNREISGVDFEGNYNVGIGCHAGRQHVCGTYDTYLGAYAGKQNGTGCRNTFVGATAGQLGNTSSNGVYLGYGAGRWETASNKLFIDNQQRASEADGRAKALVYGVFDAAVANQQLTINGDLNVAQQIASLDGITTAGHGVVPIVATVALTTQSAGIGTTNLLAAAPAGTYRVTTILTTTTLDGTAGTITTTIKYNNGAAKSIVSGATDLKTLGSDASSIWSAPLVSAAGQNITYETTVTGAVNNARYSLNIVLERIN